MFKDETSIVLIVPQIFPLRYATTTRSTQ